MNGTPLNIRLRARSALLLVAFLLAAFALAGRAVQLQVIDKGFLLDQGAARHVRTIQVPAHRGMITDRFGEPLAVSTPVDSIWVNPKELLAAPTRIPALSRAVGLPPATVLRHVRERADREFVYLKRHMSPDDARQVLALGIPGVYSQREYRRYYPAGEVTAHVLGFTNIDDAGQEGLELAFDASLRGMPGVKRVIKDRLGRSVEDIENIRSPRPGEDLRTSLDLRLQYLAYRELKAAVLENGARGGSIVVLDARTGEILAMANQPSFNPNDRGRAAPDALRNRAATDVFEPGSSFKPFPIAAALESGGYRPRTLIDTSPGFFKVGSTDIRDERNFGLIDVTTVLTKSVNTGASKIALALERETLWATLAGFGFGSQTGSGFPGEQGGALPHYQRWRTINVATMAYGYGVSVTTLQLAQAYAVFAADGVRRRLSLVPVGGDVPGERVISVKTAREMRAMLETVVSDAGTAGRAAVRGYRVSGKTGTARKAVPGGYAPDRHVAVFAGMAPATRPRVVIVVMLDEPKAGRYHGGEVAAPVFAKVMGGALRLMDVPPDGFVRQEAQPFAVAVRGSP
ncbi:MAG TPA: penicillin-binding transpeptidase domain-containing protein [Gammaproteobacteria bacterium]|nr:penicillin-binding transpeptidase domain-containing protein [Gammaproteobacteria bacterium]